MHIAKKKSKDKIYYYFAQTKRINGKPVEQIIKKLGTTEQIFNILEAYEAKTSLNPNNSLIYDFGAPIALYDICQRLEIPTIIDSYIPKRHQGLPISTYIILSAINRAIAPTSKNAFYEWFEKTTLVNVFSAANKKNLSAQSFWNNMVDINDVVIEKIEEDIVKNVIKMYNLKNDVLLLDNTNFYTYIDTKNLALIPQRGHSKEKRNDLKIVGLSLVVYPEFNIPLFHQTYPGNRNDSLQFKFIINSLKDKIYRTYNNKGQITIVFDKGNNSLENIQLLENSFDFKLNFVGSLKLNQCPELLKIPKNDFKLLKNEKFHGTSVYRTTKLIYNDNYTVLVTNNPKLYSAQLDGINNDIAKCIIKLQELDDRLVARASGKITKGIKPTIDSVDKNIKTILSYDYMSQIFNYEIYQNSSNHILCKYSINEQNFDKIKNEILGKTILFTNNHDWTDSRIVSAYRSQSHVENAFRELKNTKYMSYRPLRHFTDNNIKVHSFYCVLSLLLTSIFQLEVEQLGYQMTKDSILGEFSELKQVIGVHRLLNGAQKLTFSFSKDLNLEKGVVTEYINKFNLSKYAFN